MPAPTPVSWPSTPVKYIQTIVRGIVSGAGSNSRNTATVFNWFRTPTVLATTKSQIDTAFQAAIAAPLAAALNNRWTQTYNTVRFVNNWLDQPVRFAHAVAGAIAGDSMTTSCSAYIELTSGLRYSFNRGSKKLFPLSETDTTAGTDDFLNAGALARFGTLATAILTGFTDGAGNVWLPCVLSTKYSIQVTDPALIWAVPITGATVSGRIGTMRHRKVKSLLV